jgi:hypothetical protein
LKTPPGEYWIGFYGGAVAKYRAHPEAVVAAEETHRKAEQELMALEVEARKLADEAKAAPAESKVADTTAESLVARQKAAAAALTAAAEQLKKAIEVAKPKDIVDIVVSEPIAIRVKPAETK